MLLLYIFFSNNNNNFFFFFFVPPFVERKRINEKTKTNTQKSILYNKQCNTK